jgi:hypothetical protein
VTRPPAQGQPEVAGRRGGWLQPAAAPGLPPFSSGRGPSSRSRSLTRLARIGSGGAGAPGWPGRSARRSGPFPRRSPGPRTAGPDRHRHQRIPGQPGAQASAAAPAPGMQTRTVTNTQDNRPCLRACRVFPSNGGPDPQSGRPAYHPVLSSDWSEAWPVARSREARHSCRFVTAAGGSKNLPVLVSSARSLRCPMVSETTSAHPRHLANATRWTARSRCHPCRSRSRSGRR